MNRRPRLPGRPSLAECGAALVGAGMGLTGLWVAAPSYLLPVASADPMPATCLNTSGAGGDDDYGQFTVLETIGQAGQGARADVWFPSAEMDCQRINSMGVYSPTFNGVWEFGWVLGWSTVDDQRHLEPTMFAVGSLDSNGNIVYRKIWDGRSPAPARFHSIRASDLDADTYWGGYVDGDGGFDPVANLDFSEGYAAVNWERGHPDDEPAGGEFQQIEEHTGRPGNWNFTNDLRNVDGPGDPEYKVVIGTSNHHVEIIRR